MKGITGIYRMTNKPAPTRPSVHMGGILMHLRSFLDSTQRAGVAPVVSQRWCREIVTAVTEKYALIYVCDAYYSCSPVVGCLMSWMIGWLTRFVHRTPSNPLDVSLGGAL